MPALNFQKRFADDVESGKKRQTIRAMRKRPFKTGDRLYLYTGMRTKACRKLGEATCTGVATVDMPAGTWGEIILNGQSATTAERAELARRDGFKCASDLLGWFANTHGLPFHGQGIRW